jgi:hypothetical protein
MIRFACECGRLLQASATQAGSSATCPACECVLVVPDEAMAEECDRARQMQLAVDVQRSATARAIESPVSKKQRSPHFDGRVSRKAIVSFLVGIVLVVAFSMPFFQDVIGPLGDKTTIALWIAVILNFALALSAHKDISRNPVQLGGNRLATVGALSLPLCLVLGLLQPSGCRVGAWSPNVEARMNLSMLGLAFHNFHQKHGHFPGSAIRSPDGKPLLSWRVAILPYIDEDPRYKLLHLDEPWDSPHNLPLLAPTPSFYADGEHDSSDGLTRFQAYVGPGSAFENPQGHKFVDFTDGLDKTVLITEGEQWVPWTKPVDLPFGPEVVLVRPHARKMHVGLGSWLLRGDGSCYFVRADAPEEMLRAYITRNGGEDIDWPK